MLMKQMRQTDVFSPRRIHTCVHRVAGLERWGKCGVREGDERRRGRRRLWLHREDEDGVDGGGGGSGGDECDNDGEGEGKGEEEEVMVVVVVAVCMSEVGMCYGAISNLGAGGAGGRRSWYLPVLPS